MKHSIAQKLFLTVLGMFILVLLVQWLALSRYFGDIYLNTIMDSHQNELFLAVDCFPGGQ